MSFLTKGVNMNKSEKFPYPKCWDDDDRCSVLFAPFRLKEVNVENYESKLKFWQNLIITYCEHMGSPCFNKQQLQIAFTRKEKIPFGLDVVIDSMLTGGNIRNKAEFLYDPENSWSGWAINSFVKKPLNWSLRKIVPYNENEPADNYVLLDTLNKFTKNLYTVTLQKYSGNVLHYDELKTIIQNEMNLNDEGIEMCLSLLNSQKKIGIEYKSESSNGNRIHLVKIPSKNDVNVQITQSDKAIHDLKITRNNLIDHLNELENNIKQNDEKVQEYLKSGKRQLAKTYLRKKHLLEKNHEKRSLALHNVETLLCSVEEAQSNGEILDAYKIGSKALKNVLDESGLTYDSADEIVSDIKEQIETHEDIQDVLSNAALSSIGAENDDADIEQELSDMLSESCKTLLKEKSPSSPRAVMEDKNSINNNVPSISDDDLLKMLESLEVDQDKSKTSLSSNSSTKQDKSMSGN